MANVTSLRDEAETQRNRDQSVQTRLITETTTLEQHVKTLQVELDACRSSSEEWKHRYVRNYIVNVSKTSGDVGASKLRHIIKFSKNALKTSQPLCG